MARNQPIKKMISKSFRETELAGRKLAESKTVSPVCLYGDLGTGKTVFVRGFAEGLGIPKERVKSPTFNFVREYILPNGTFSHCDFYRLSEIDEILAHQLEEACEKGPVIIEWAEKASKVLPEKRTDIHFEYVDENSREITVETYD